MNRIELEKACKEHNLIYNRTRLYLVPYFLTNYNVKIKVESPIAWFIYNEASLAHKELGLVALYNAKDKFENLKSIRENKMYIADDTLWFDNFNSYFHLFYFRFGNDKAMVNFLRSKYSEMYSYDEIQRAYSDKRLAKLSKQSRSLQISAKNTLLKEEKRRIDFENEVNSLSKTDDYRTRISITPDVEYDFKVNFKDEIITVNKDSVLPETLEKIQNYESLFYNHTNDVVL